MTEKTDKKYPWTATYRLLDEMRDPQKIYANFREGGADCDVIDPLSVLKHYADRFEQAVRTEMKIQYQFGRRDGYCEAIGVMSEHTKKYWEECVKDEWKSIEKDNRNHRRAKDD